MRKKKLVTAQISKRFTLEEVTLLIEAISVFKDSKRRMTTGIFDRDGRMYSDKRREALKTENIMELMSSGEIEIKSVPRGPKFTTEEQNCLEELWDVFIAGLARIENRIEHNITTEVEENIVGVIDDLYTMLKGEKQ